MHIIGTDTGNGVLLIAVNINQSLKAVLFAAVKQPVNRAFSRTCNLISITMILKKFIYEIITNHILRLTFAAQCICNKFQVFVQCICTVNGFHKLHEQTDNIILEVFIIANRDNVILIRSKRSILVSIPFATCISKTIHIQRVTTKHTTNCVRNERANISAKISFVDGHIIFIYIWDYFAL